jgi:trans-aconitate methyltransferase
VGGNPLSDILASTSQWDAADYARVGGFVPALGQAALELLDPQPGEAILDVGCGDGALTQKILERGASVVGIDNSLSMVGAARARGLDARLMDAAQLKFGEAFDAVFSNATLHWVLDKERAARAIWFALKPGGRFAGEMGGEGNLAVLRQALDDELVARGFGPPTFAANWYPSVEEFVALYEAAGFRDIDARLIERPTPLEHGVAAWVLTFRAGWLDRAGVPDDERQTIADAVAARVGTEIADYVRLRFIMRKPH